MRTFFYGVSRAHIFFWRLTHEKKKNENTYVPIHVLTYLARSSEQEKENTSKYICGAHSFPSGRFFLACNVSFVGVKFLCVRARLSSDVCAMRVAFFCTCFSVVASGRNNKSYEEGSLIIYQTRHILGGLTSELLVVTSEFLAAMNEFSAITNELIIGDHE